MKTASSTHVLAWQLILQLMQQLILPLLTSQ
jgi:hypothetical protein